MIQVEMNPSWQQKNLREFSKAKGIVITTFSPLGAKGANWGTNEVMDNELLKEIAQTHGKTVAQVLLINTLLILYSMYCLIFINITIWTRTKAYVILFLWNRYALDGYMSKVWHLQWRVTIRRDWSKTWTYLIGHLEKMIMRR